MSDDEDRASSVPSNSDGTPCYDAFDRSTPAGRKLFALYNGDNAGRKVGNRISQKNREAHQKKVENGYVPPVVEPEKWGKRQVEMHDNTVNVPVPTGYVEQDRFDNPGRPGIPLRGKKKESEIKLEQKLNQLELESAPAPPPRGPLLDEKEKIRYARKLEFNGRPPEEQPEGTFKRKPPPAKPLTRLQEYEKLFDTVVGEIQEREQFLEEMEHMGTRHKYEAQIKTEIQARLKQLEKLDKEIKGLTQ